MKFYPVTAATTILRESRCLLNPWRRNCLAALLGLLFGLTVEAGARNVKIGSEIGLERFQAQLSSTQMGNLG